PSGLIPAVYRGGPSRGRVFTRSSRVPMHSLRVAHASNQQDRMMNARWLAAVGGPLAVSGLLLIVRDDVFATNAALVLVLPVLAAAIVGGRWGGVVSAVVAALCFDFFFTRPYYSFTISRHDDVETTVVLLAVGLVVGEVVVRARRTARA